MARVVDKTKSKFESVMCPTLYISLVSGGMRLEWMWLENESRMDGVWE